VNRLGVKVDETSDEPAQEMVLTEMRMGELSVIIVPVKCRRSEMPAKGSLIANAEKYH